MITLYMRGNSFLAGWFSNAEGENKNIDILGYLEILVFAYKSLIRWKLFEHDQVEWIIQNLRWTPRKGWLVQNWVRLTLSCWSTGFPCHSFVGLFICPMITLMVSLWLVEHKLNPDACINFATKESHNIDLVAVPTKEKWPKKKRFLENWILVLAFGLLLMVSITTGFTN